MLGWRLLLAVVVGMVAACSTNRLPAIPQPPTTVPLVTTTTSTATDNSGVELAAVRGRTTRTTVSVGPGTATLRGTVVGPGGSVPGAVVHAERLVGEASAAVEVVTGPDGRWELPGVKGGRYRLRGWRAPDLALLRPEVFFLASNEAKSVNLVLESHSGLSVVSAIAPHPPVVNQAANLGVQVVERRVDERGIVRTAPLAQALIQLLAPGQWELASANPTVTDGAGSARWQLRCRMVAPQPLTAVVGAGQQFALDIPPCAG